MRRCGIGVASQQEGAMSIDRDELLRVAALIYANRDYKGKPVSIEDAVDEAVDLIRQVEARADDQNRETK
jgi:hypothetical protein